MSNSEFPYLGEQDRFQFPSPERASREGIVAAGGNLSPGMLLSAYSQGIFPWFSEFDPILWWSPDPRFVLFPETLHVSKTMRKFLRHTRLSFTVDADFDAVITACAEVPRRGQGGTWITDEMLEGYRELHRLGYAHSVEVWEQPQQGAATPSPAVRGEAAVAGDPPEGGAPTGGGEPAERAGAAELTGRADHREVSDRIAGRDHGRLVGGLYGVSLGRLFFGESMFSRVSNASKAAFILFVRRLREKGFQLIDSQVYTKHLESLGAQDISRDRYLELLERGLQFPTFKGSWNGLLDPTRSWEPLLHT